MSDFHLTEIAPFVEKDARTLRRWCVLGHVPGAYRRPGRRGHWRIRGKSVQHVVQRITANKPPAARLRRENAYPPVPSVEFFMRGAGQVTPRQAWARLSPDQIASLSVRKPRGRRSKRVESPLGVFNLSDRADRARCLVAVIAHLRSTVISATTQDQSRALSSLDLEWIARNATAEYYDAVVTELCAVPTTKQAQQRLGPTALAVDMGISRSTFYRWFAGWRTAAFGGVASAPKVAKIGHEQDHGRRGAPIYELIQPDNEPSDADNYNAVG